MESQQSVAVKKAVVIYHDNCMDGFASAWAFHVLKEKDYPEGVEYIPCAYGNDRPLPYPYYGDRDLFVVDFSFSREWIADWAPAFNTVTILDHHKTAKEALENWEDKPSNVEIVFDMSRSGAGITWDYFAHTELPPRDLMIPSDRPPLIQYVEDRDLWKFQLKMSKEVNAVIAITPKDFRSYATLSANMEADIRVVAEIGTYLNLQHQQICESIVKDARPIVIVCTPGEIGYHGLACNCTGQFSSEVGNMLALSGGSFGATYFSDREGKVKWSLRSTGDYDVSKIAKSFGGGGHKNAAGFVIDLNLEEGVDPGVIVLRAVP